VSTKPNTVEEPTMRLRGKVALVTGAQQGIGRGIALAFAREGADVAVNYLDDRAAAEQVAEAIRAAGRRATLAQADVARPDAAAALVGQVRAELGGLDVLVNNAGVYPRVPFLDMRETDWDLVLDVNLKGSFFCAQAAARAMIAGGRRGAIIHMASQAIRGAVHGVHYSASKGGVVAMTRAMALELASHGIRVNAIAPGLTDTAQPRYGHGEDELAEMARAVPLGRMAQPDDIAAVAVFLAGDDARHVTGQTMHVNGGSYMP
jgi:NAD(P)-dependent dehydrogenase (short-subunit alcohol dehydrogenase family)